MRSRRVLLIVGGILVLAAGVAAALFLTGRRDVTTSSQKAYEAFQRGLEAERRFYFKDAQLAFARALELDPDFPMAMLGLARQVGGDQAKSLIKRAERMRDRVTERERMHIDLMVTGQEKGQEAAYQIAEQIHQRFPEDIRAAHIVCGFEMARGNIDRAMRIYRDLLERDPNIAEAYNMIGYYEAYRDDYPKAIENLKKYQFMAPDQANPHDSLGEVQANFGHYDEAIANLNRALEIKPDFFPAYEHLGVAYEGKGDWEQALHSYKRAAELSVADELRRAYCFKRLRVAIRTKNREAMHEIYTEIERLPKDPEFEPLRSSLLSAGKALYSEGRPADAERILEKVKSELYEVIAKKVRLPGYKPYDAGFNFSLAKAKVELGKDAEALAIYSQMIEPPNRPNNFEDRRWIYEARAEMAALLAKTGELDKAEALLAANRRWNPSWAPSREAELTVARLRREKVLSATRR
jgi:tetratricopeptide (TPR) repeat protein